VCLLCLIRDIFTCKDIDFRFGFSASGGLTAAVEAGWAGDVGWDEAAGLLTPPAMLLPELWADIAPPARAGTDGDAEGVDPPAARGSGIGPNPGGVGRSSMGIGFPAL